MSAENVKNLYENKDYTVLKLALKTLVKRPDLVSSLEELELASIGELISSWNDIMNLSDSAISDGMSQDDQMSQDDKRKYIVVVNQCYNGLKFWAPIALQNWYRNFAKTEENYTREDCRDIQDVYKCFKFIEQNKEILGENDAILLLTCLRCVIKHYFIAVKIPPFIGFETCPDIHQVAEIFDVENIVHNDNNRIFYDICLSKFLRQIYEECEEFLKNLFKAGNVSQEEEDNVGCVSYLIQEMGYGFELK